MSCSLLSRKKKIGLADAPDNEEQKIEKRSVRVLTRNYITAGKLIKEPCEICGTDKDVEAHHDDYTKPYLTFAGFVVNIIESTTITKRIRNKNDNSSRTRTKYFLRRIPVWLHQAGLQISNDGTTPHSIVNI